MLSLASSLVGLVSSYMRKDNMGGTQGAAQYFSKETACSCSLNSYFQALLSFLHMNWFWGMFQVSHEFPRGEIKQDVRY